MELLPECRHSRPCWPGRLGGGCPGHLSEEKIILQQENNFKTIVGEVINDTIDISGIHVINSTSGAKTITDNKGFFKVGVRENDSIFFQE